MTRAFTSINTWKHIVVTCDGGNSSAGLKIYVDSVVGQVSTHNNAFTGTIKHSDPAFLGHYNLASPNALQGSITCVRNYNRVLNQAEVNQLFNAGAGLYSVNPFGGGSSVASWMFCTGSGMTLIDGAGFGLDGTLVNMEEGDWVPGKVPCPDIPEQIEVIWTTPAVVDVGSRIRIWLKSMQLGVHKQLVISPNVSDEVVPVTECRIAQGKTAPMGTFPGNYLIQTDVIQPNGLRSPPSNTVEVIVP
ncbi:hypothetical protein ES708_23043 [subsurface metagenome]